MALTIGEEYRALAEECARRATLAKDTNTKMEWLKLAKSWKVLAERKKPIKSSRPLLIRNKIVARGLKTDEPT